MTVHSTPIQGVFRVETRLLQDERGSFYRAFCDTELDEILGSARLRQINVSQTDRVGAVRGLHFQHPPHAETKMVRCLRGKVWDVVVDLRAGSSTFRNWHSEILSADNQWMLVVPPGCAHGFQVLSPESQLLYLHSHAYEPSSEGGVRYDDPGLAIQWPQEVTQVSLRDRSFALLPVDFPGITL